MQVVEDRRGEKQALKLAVVKILREKGGEAAEPGVLEDLADLAGSCNSTSNPRSHRGSMTWRCP